MIYILDRNLLRIKIYSKQISEYIHLKDVVSSGELTKLRSNVQIGTIPDATTIHLAKKQREIARRKQEQDTSDPLPTFIPINKRTTKTEDVLMHKTQHNSSRLIREEMDVDLSEEDECLTKNQDSDKNRQNKNPYNREISSDEDEEVMRWEEEQMMKGVTTGVITEEYAVPDQQGGNYPNTTGYSGYGEYYHRNDTNTENRNIYSGTEQYWRDTENSANADLSVTEISVQSMLQAVRREHAELEETSNFTEMECDRNLKTILATEESFTVSKDTLEKEKKNYRFFKEIGDYVHDLLDCIGEKVAIVDRIESQILGIRSDISNHIIERRKEILLERDQLSRQDISVPQSAYPCRVEIDLMTDNEKIKFNEYCVSFNKKKKEVLQEASELFSDALEEYSTAEQIIQRFEFWRIDHGDSYQQSFIPLFLPKLLATYVRLDLLHWDPLSSEGVDWKLHRWYSSLCPISNPENEILSPLIEQTILPILTETARSIWDPVSTAQTKLLALSVIQINQVFPNLLPNKPMQSILKIVSDKFVTATQGFYMPMFIKDHLEKNSESNSLLSYQFWLGVDLGTNISLWTGLLPEQTILDLILDGLLNRYLTLALHQFSDCIQSVEKCNRIVEFLPDCVKRGLHDTEVGALVRYMCWLVEALDRESMTGPDFIKKRAREGKLEMISLVRCLASEQATHLENQFVKK
ncbi:PAX3- and PAX7-binding protein 1 [Oopsacas minuta]|uniref:PAX3- and PAX7-binding protein 1 n=1 Tax=Oopsacas minuta TaxID=111878 RepID=A0AAV7JCQ3_9METZ|nr:PAX3- and PAX7-binding protein 1 [Oopsacas minuta]